MAVTVSAEYKTSAAVGAREDLSDIIARIDPSEVPLHSAMKKGTRNAISFDWQVQELATAGANAQSEGGEITSYEQTTTDRFQNHMQISRKAFAVSGPLDAISTAGRARESAYQSVLKGLEIRRDVEFTMLHDQVKSLSDPRKAGTLSSWITNVVNAADFIAGTHNGDGSTLPGAATDSNSDGIADAFAAATAEALSVDKMDTAMQAAFEDGGKPTMILLSPTQKKKFSDATEGASGTVSNQINYSAPQEVTSVGAVSVYLSDFGGVEAVVDRFAPNDRAYLIDPEHVEFVTLPGRNFATQDLANDGDRDRGFVVCEWSMEFKAQKAHAALYSLTTS